VAVDSALGERYYVFGLKCLVPEPLSLVRKLGYGKNERLDTIKAFLYSGSISNAPFWNSLGFLPL
jgi:hypothetical protein